MNPTLGSDRFDRCVLSLVTAAALLPLAAVAQKPQREPPRPGRIVVDDGLSAPECVIHDERADIYLVSNVNGSPLAKDDNGFVSRVAPDGKVVDLHWIDGAQDAVTLHAPKGMALSGEVLYVADIDVVRRFDRGSGKPLPSWPIRGSTFLNDLFVDRDGRLWVTDTGTDKTRTDAVYRLDEHGAPTAVAHGESLQGPNGIVAYGDGAAFVTFAGHRLQSVTADGKVATIAELPQGRLDGLIALGDGWLVSSWQAQGVYRVRVGDAADLVVGDVPSPASIHLDRTRHRLLIPQMQEDRVVIEPLPEGAMPRGK